MRDSSLRYKIWLRYAIDLFFQTLNHGVIRTQGIFYFMYQGHPYGIDTTYPIPVYLAALGTYLLTY